MFHSTNSAVGRASEAYSGGRGFKSHWVQQFSLTSNLIKNIHINTGVTFEENLRGLTFCGQNWQRKLICGKMNPLYFLFVRIILLLYFHLFQTPLDLFFWERTDFLDAQIKHSILNT